MIKQIRSLFMREGVVRTAGAMILALILSLPTSLSLAQTQVSPDSAPPSWLAFADVVNRTVTEQLRADDVTAIRLRNYVSGLRPDPAQSSPPVILRVWTDATGVITKVEFPAFAQDEPKADLRALLIGQSVGTAPPHDILFPLRLAIQLDPMPPESAGSP